ncbi:PhzF family phenazine biosynthesis protein [Romeria aff. gracilis LEGE 07310]|uniref:PhzF family phenazine biosynthesis protein n=1 Tax=Vasconcelosia minhoensis LEGE 07310 TaxID=915328 RepID=A0A8J7A492_9CYAN|nr:PhzF family phenazine biosynthesis protein [Romeria aff. gracilis LEGE 07310]
MGLTIVQVDAFAAQPFEGNPAAVCVVAQPLDDGLMQAIAMEMNLSETAFLYPLEDGYSLRWFTPAAEVDLCGHATLASAHVLWSDGHLAADQEARFHTRSGLLTARRQGDWIELNFPAQSVHATHVTPQLIGALCCGGNIRYVAKDESHYLIELQSEAVVQKLKPDFAKVAALPVQGVIATAPAEAESVDFVSRYFAPAVGINEDPVTGSTHTVLAPYWQEKLGKSELVAHQISARGGVLQLRCEGDRVFISGQAVTTLRGELLVG